MFGSGKRETGLFEIIINWKMGLLPTPWGKHQKPIGAPDFDITGDPRFFSRKISNWEINNRVSNYLLPLQLQIKPNEKQPENSGRNYWIYTGR